MNQLGERFRVTYAIGGADWNEAYAKAKDICVEQTVEFPEELLPNNLIRQQLLGRIEAFREVSPKHYEAEISFAVETTAGELTQLLNVVFGNISIKPGLRVEAIQFSSSLLSLFKGPRFGRTGLRNMLQVSRRPLLHTALKPMGLSAVELAQLAYQCAVGGIDIIKDDHGLTNQCFAPFTERVSRCAEAVNQANQKTGGHSIYVANVTAGPLETLRRAKLAKAAGAQGLLIAPALAGLDTMRQLAEDDEIQLPVFSHPAFQGSYVIHPQAGISHYAYYGQITRLAGADAVIYPNFGGRFSFSKQECAAIVAGSVADMGPIQPIFPSPGGGISLDKIPSLLSVYGADVIFLIGGGLFRHGPDLVANCRYFRSLVEQYA